MFLFMWFDGISCFTLEKLAWRFCKYFRFSYRTPYRKEKLNKEIKEN